MLSLPTWELFLKDRQGKTKDNGLMNTEQHLEQRVVNSLMNNMPGHSIHWNYGLIFRGNNDNTTKVNLFFIKSYWISQSIMQTITCLVPYLVWHSDTGEYVGWLSFFWAFKEHFWAPTWVRSDPPASWGHQLDVQCVHPFSPHFLWEKTYTLNSLNVLSMFFLKLFKKKLFKQHMYSFHISFTCFNINLIYSKINLL